MKSTTSLRPAMPPPPALLLMYFAAPFTPSTAPLNSPGASGLSTSAITAMWISLAVTPISVALGVSLLDCAVACARPSDDSASAVRATTSVRRILTIVLPLRPGLRPGWRAYCIQMARVAVVTGGASGIGRATARLLAGQGAAVAVFDVAGDPPVDVRDSRSVADAVARVHEQLGGIDIVVNAAGIPAGGVIGDDGYPDQW